jgi:hypothetical protein
VNPASQIEAAEQLRNVVDVVSASSDPNGPFAFCTRFDTELWNKWAKTETMRRYVEKSEHEVFRIFLLDDYFAIMSNVLQKVAQTDVRAKVLPHEGCNDSVEIRKRQALLGMMTPTMYRTVDIEIRGLWLSNKSKQSALMQTLLPEEPPQAFWIEHYYQVVATVATSPSTGGSASADFQSNTSTG